MAAFKMAQEFERFVRRHPIAVSRTRVRSSWNARTCVAEIATAVTDFSVVTASFGDESMCLDS